jgi:hypothetical protein
MEQEGRVGRLTASNNTSSNSDTKFGAVCGKKIGDARWIDGYEAEWTRNEEGFTPERI